MKRVYYILLAIFISVMLNNRYSFAVMNEQLIRQNMAISVVEERQKSQQAYQAYKAKKAELSKEAVKFVSKPDSLPENDYLKRRNDIFIGITFIVIAIILTVWLMQFYKKEQK